MKPFKMHLMCLMTLLCLFSACKKHELNAETQQNKEKSDPLPKVENGYLVFIDSKQYTSYLLQTLKLSCAERKQLEDQVGFKSFKQAYDDFKIAYNNLPEDIDSIALNKFMDAHKGVVIKEDNYGGYRINAKSSIEASAANIDGVFKIGETLIKLEPTRITAIKRGSLSDLKMAAKIETDYRSENMTVQIISSPTVQTAKQAGIMAETCINGTTPINTSYGFSLQSGPLLMLQDGDYRMRSQMSILNYQAPDGSYKGAIINSFYGEKRTRVGPIVGSFKRFASSGIYSGDFSVYLRNSANQESSRRLEYINYKPNGEDDNLADMEDNNDVIAISSYFLDKAHLFSFNSDLFKDISAGVDPRYVIDDSSLGVNGYWSSFCLNGVPLAMEYWFRLLGIVDNHNMPPIYFAY